MAILQIKTYPDKILRQRSQPVGDITDTERKLLRDMFDTMYFSNGVGLAAPQVGILKRIIVCNPTQDRRSELAIINPRIIYRKGRRVKDCEGCLSIPSMTAEISRFSIVGVAGKDPFGKEIKLEASDLLARIIDHEADHLNGILFVDRVGFLKRKIIINRYRKKVGLICTGRLY